MNKILMHAPCNTKLAAQQLGAIWTIGEACPAGTAIGTPIPDLLNLCVECPRRMAAGTTLTVEKKDDKIEGGSGGVHEIEGMALPDVAPSPPPLEPPAAPVMPPPLVEAQQQMPAPLIQLPASAPAVMPAPLAAPVAPAPAVMPAALIPVQIPMEQEPAFIEETQPSQELIAAEDIILPGGMSMRQIEEKEPNLDVILAGIPGLPFSGSSSGGFSSHKLADAKCWRCFYLKHILGMQPRKTRRPLQLGTLYHAVMAMRYSGHADRQYEPLNFAAQAGLTDMAVKLRAMCEMQFEKFRQQEWSTWCVRAVEHNMLAWLPVRIGKKTIGVPISCRADMLLGLKRPDEPHPPGGPLPRGIFLVDHKTSSAITQDLVEGYGMDFQFLTEAAVLTLGGHEEVFGQFRGVIVTIACTSKKNPTFDDFVRIESPIPKESLAAFIEYELKPLAAECYERVTNDETRGDEHNWPMDRRQCIGRWGRCDMFEYCDRASSIMYKIVPERILTKEFLEKPPRGWSADAPEETASPVQKPKAKKLPAELSEQTGLLAKAILSQIESGDIPKLTKENFIVPGHTFQSVMKGLSAGLRATYETLAAEKKTFPLEGLEWRFAKTGCAWRSASGEKGRTTWKGVAEWICRHSWFDLSTALPR